MNAFGIGLALLLGVSAASRAGDRIGNGGSAWVCRNEGAVTWVSLTDVFEARHELGLEIPAPASVGMEQLLSEAEIRVFRANRDFYAALEPHLAKVRKELRVLDGSLGLAPIADVLPRIFPKEETCVGGSIRLEQLANFTTAGELIVDRELWERLPSVDQAALYLHEGIYSLLREKEGVQDSRRARRLTGFAFSSLPADRYATEFVLQIPALPPDDGGWTDGFSKTGMLRIQYRGKQVRITLDNRESKWAYLCTGVMEIKLGRTKYIVTLEETFKNNGLLVLPGKVEVREIGTRKPVTRAEFHGTCSGV